MTADSDDLPWMMLRSRPLSMIHRPPYCSEQPMPVRMNMPWVGMTCCHPRLHWSMLGHVVAVVVDVVVRRIHHRPHPIVDHHTFLLLPNRWGNVRYLLVDDPSLDGHQFQP